MKFVWIHNNVIQLNEVLNEPVSISIQPLSGREISSGDLVEGTLFWNIESLSVSSGVYIL